MEDLNGKTIVVTGAAGGLGQEYGKQLIRLGANLILTDYDEVAMKAVAEKIAAKKSATGKALAAFGADVSTPEGCAELHRRATEAAPEIDLLINNAGVINYGYFHEIPANKWERLIAVNLLAPMRLTHLFLPAMVKRGAGRIAFMCSVAGFISTPLGTPYATSKFGMRGFALGVAGEVERFGVGVSIIYPFWVNTQLLKSPEYGEAQVGKLPSVFYGNPRNVVRRAIRGIRKGRRHIYPDLYSWFCWHGSKLWPFTSEQAH